ncbi:MULTISPECIES: ATP-binding protein [unclassified Streptomyces]|uniref:ATP-binding protein n=1 Tax=unclassified Streptomyces TaxID=2593676 RepID=UPI002E2B41CA|nr:ATP-binding protein [Streptomyces sp. NBC_01429]
MHHLLRSDNKSDIPDGPTEWACRPELAAEAREATDGFLAGLCPEPSDRTRQNLLLVVSELVTNALRHAGEVTSLRLRADRRSLQIEVRDPSPVLPLDRTPDLTGRSGGFGWPMVQRLADRVSVRPASGGGKMILAVLVR